VAAVLRRKSHPIDIINQSKTIAKNNVVVIKTLTEWKAEQVGGYSIIYHVVRLLTSYRIKLVYESLGMW
jgi:hypothetical protein